MTFDYGGYAGKTLRVDLTKGKVITETQSKNRVEKYLGGRGADAKILFDELIPNINPLHSDNVLCISTGPITGLLGPTTGRINVATKSPLTDIYGNSNAGSDWGSELKYAGYDNIIIKGKSPKPVYLCIDDDHVELKNASHLWGEGIFETTLALQEEHRGFDTKVAAIGPAAEKGVLFCSIIFNLWDAAGRTGTGTVMASKNLKAVTVSGSGELKVADPDRYLEIVRDGWLGILNDPGFRSGEHQALGTPICVNWGDALGWLPTRNFRETTFEGADLISGEEFRDKYSTRSSPIPGGRACMSCPNRCKRFGRIESGKYAGTRGAIEFEGIAAFGSKCGVSDLEAVFHAYTLSNDYGMDCVSCGNTIATFMELVEEGVLKDEDKLGLKFGNADAMVEMVHRIGNKKEKLGALGALGAYKAALKIGKNAVDYTTSIKGIDTIACDPRVAKGFGFTYAISSRGSDHLRTHVVFEMIRMPPEIGKELFGSEGACDMMSFDGKVELVLWHENLAAVTDSIGSCRFMHGSYYAQYPVPELLGKLHNKKDVNSIKYHDWISAATGMKIDYKKMLEIGHRIVTIERALNTQFGIRRKDDRLPKKFLEPIKKGPKKGQSFPKKQLEKMLDEYYNVRGWDLKTGLIKKSELIKLDMKDVLLRLEKKNLVM